MDYKVITVLLVAGTFAMPAVGQTTNPGRTGRTDTVQREQQRQVEMQMIEQALATEGKPARVKRYPADVLDQIRTDFLKIQIFDRQLVKTTKPPGEIDLKLVRELSGEISKRSRRLKSNLALPQPDSSKNPQSARLEFTNEQLRASLTDMSNLIEAFVSNPIFEHSKLFDQQLSDKAWHDLTMIIELSESIKRGSEKLRKSR